MLTIWKLCTKHDVKFVQHFTDHIVYIGYGKSAAQKEGRQAKMSENIKIERYILDNGTQSELIVSDGHTIADIFHKMIEDPYTIGVPSFTSMEPDRIYGIVRTWIADSDPEYLYRVELIPYPWSLESASGTRSSGENL